MWWHSGGTKLYCYRTVAKKLLKARFSEHHLDLALFNMALGRKLCGCDLEPRPTLETRTADNGPSIKLQKMIYRMLLPRQLIECRNLSIAE